MRRGWREERKRENDNSDVGYGVCAFLSDFANDIEPWSWSRLLAIKRNVVEWVYEWINSHRLAMVNGNVIATIARCVCFIASPSYFRLLLTAKCVYWSMRIRIVNKSKLIESCRFCEKSMETIPMHGGRLKWRLYCHGKDPLKVQFMNLSIALRWMSQSR